MVSIIVAMGKNRAIGKEGKLMWHLKNDLRRFASLTKGHSVIMGRKTAESIILRNKKPLPERNNILVTRKGGYALQGFNVVHSLDEALFLVKDEKEVFIIGGAGIYSLALPLTRKIYLTEVDDIFFGDAFFPRLNSTEWEVLEGPKYYPEDEDNNYGYSFSILERLGLKS